MPPKAKFTKEEVVNAAIALVRKEGAKGLTVRTLARALGCSVCPIFTLFSGMEEVVQAVLLAANTRYEGYLKEDMERGIYPPYKGSGMAYIRFAEEEKELFKLLFMRDRSGEEIEKSREGVRPLLELLMKQLAIDEDEAFLFHLELWLYVHGIATMIATSYLDWDMDFVSNALTDAYQGLKWRYTEGKNVRN